MRRIAVAGIVAVFALTSCGGDDAGDDADGDDAAVCGEVRELVDDRVAEARRLLEMMERQFGTERETSRQNGLFALDRSTILVEQNPDCFDASTRADAEALRRLIEQVR